MTDGLRHEQLAKSSSPASSRPSHNGTRDTSSISAVDETGSVSPSATTATSTSSSRSTFKRTLLGNNSAFVCRRKHFLARPLTFHEGDVRSLYNRPVRLDEMDAESAGTSMDASRVGAESSSEAGMDSQAQGVEESVRGGDRSRPDMRTRVRSLRHGAAENMHPYRTRGGAGEQEGGDGGYGADEASRRDATSRGEMSSVNATSGQRATLQQTWSPDLEDEGISAASRPRRLSQHQDATRLAVPVPILRNRSGSTREPSSSSSPSHTPTHSLSGTATPAAASSAGHAENSSLDMTKQRMARGVPRMEPIRTDTASLRPVDTALASRDHRTTEQESATPLSRNARQPPMQSRQNTLTPSALASPTTPHASTQSGPPPPSHTTPAVPPSQPSPPTPSVSQPTHQIGHWQTYGPGVAPPPYTEQPVFHYPFGRNRGGHTDGSASGSGGSGAGGSGQAGRALTWAREPTRARRNRDAQGGVGSGSGGNSRASSADRNSGQSDGENDAEPAAQGVDAAAQPSSSIAPADANSPTGQAEGENREQREQRIERRRKKGPLEPLGLPSPFAKASKDRVPDFKSGLREGAIGAWAEVREGLKGPVGLPWYWAKEGGVLGMVGGLSYGVTVLALCPISASIVFLNHSSRGAIRQTRTAHQNRQLAKSRSRSGTTTGLPRTGSMDERSTLRRRESILSRTASRASASPTDRTERVSMSMTGDELRRAVSIHGTGVSSDDEQDTVEGTAVGEGEAEGASNASLRRTASRGSRWRLSRRRGKARRVDPAETDVEVEEGTPTNSTLQSSSGRSAAGASAMTAMSAVSGTTEGSPRVERRLTQMEREAKWGNFDTPPSGHQDAGSGSGSDAGPSGAAVVRAGRYLSDVERETKLNLFPEVHSPALGNSSGESHRSRVDPGSPRTAMSSRTNGTGTSPLVAADGHHDDTSRLELDTKWPISDSPAGLSPESHRHHQVMTNSPIHSRSTGQHQRQPSQRSQRDIPEGHVSGIEMDTKWQLPTAPRTEPEASRTSDVALEEKRALERAIRASTGPDREAVGHFRTNSLGGRHEPTRRMDGSAAGQGWDATSTNTTPAPSSDRYPQRHGAQRDRMPSLGLMINGQEREEDLPVIQAIDAGVSFQGSSPVTSMHRQPQTQLQQQPPRLPQLRTIRDSPVDVSQAEGCDRAPPPPLMTPTAYEMDIKWPLPASGPSTPAREQTEEAGPGVFASSASRRASADQRAAVPIAAGESRHYEASAPALDSLSRSAPSMGDVGTPEPSPPEPSIRTPGAAHEPLRPPARLSIQKFSLSQLQEGGTIDKAASPDRSDGPGYAYTPLTKTDTLPSTIDVETSTFAETDLDSSFTPSQSASQSQSLAHSPQYLMATHWRKGFPLPSTQGSLSPAISTLSPGSASPVTPFDMERHYREGFKREGYGWNSGVSMGGEGGRRLSL